MDLLTYWIAVIIAEVTGLLIGIAVGYEKWGRVESEVEK